MTVMYTAKLQMLYIDESFKEMHFSYIAILVPVFYCVPSLAAFV